jgi:hypothetical protein
VARILKKDAERLLGKVPDEYVFRCSDGRIMNSMQELGDALNLMSDDTYSYHANAERNDFGNWVRDVIGDQKLTNDLLKAADRTKAVMAVANRVAFLNTKL